MDSRCTVGRKLEHDKPVRLDQFELARLTGNDYSTGNSGSTLDYPYCAESIVLWNESDKVSGGERIVCREDLVANSASVHERLILVASDRRLRIRHKVERRVQRPLLCNQRRAFC